MTLPELNALDEARFVALLGAVFEHSPWVAAEAWSRRPFASVAALHEAMLEVVREAPDERQLALLCAHPELAGREARKGALTESSHTEQGRLGLLSLDRGQAERIAEINRRYRQRFGFPCIVALKLHATLASVMAEMHRRLGNTEAAERATALEQIGHITRGRLDKILGGA